MSRFDFQLNNPELLREDCFIGGDWLGADDRGRLDVSNPATGATIASVPLGGTSEARRAIQAADRALPAWKAKTATERGRILRAWYELIMRHDSDLARIMTLEQGKPYTEAKAEIAYAASYVEWYAEECKRADGEILPSPWATSRLLVLKQPVGVCAAITPWNFPAAMITRKVAPALAAGCTMVLKPAELTPLSALALAELAHRAGVPAGVLNVVTGDSKAIGAELTSNPVVRKLSFTGSTAVGRLLMTQCASTVKKLSLELGGNAPFIVFDDADIDAAVAGAIASKFRNAGQTCICSNRFLVQDGVYDVFAAKLAAAVATLKAGCGLDEQTTQGPLINDAAVLKVESLVSDAIEGGARLLAGGGRVRSDGLWFEPTVLTEVNARMEIAKQEIFGPVAPLIRFHTEAEAIAFANDSEFGLAAYLYTRDLGRLWRVAESLETGMVGANTGVISTAVAPFGGIKNSGFGREGSRHGLDEYLELKYLAVGGL